MSVMSLADDLGGALERMIRTQMTAYPAVWTEQERREAAIAALFGEEA
jgi:hypothetical protein